MTATAEMKGWIDMIDKIIENWGKAQKSGAWLPCPRCGLLTMKEDLYSNAFSRRADVYVCDSCGTQEAIEDMPYGGNNDKLPLGAWFVLRNVYGQSGVVPKGKGFEVVATHPILLTVEDIDDIMVCALEGGINYWCDKAVVLEHSRVADWGHEQIARGGSLILHDSEEDKIYELTLEKFLTGFKLWVEQGLDHYNAVCGKTVDCCEIDASCADNIVQLALFGEVLYA